MSSQLDLRTSIAVFDLQDSAISSLNTTRVRSCFESCVAF